MPRRTMDETLAALGDATLDELDGIVRAGPATWAIGRKI
jgi:hypothetical protein